MCVSFRQVYITETGCDRIDSKIWPIPAGKKFLPLRNDGYIDEDIV